MKSFLGLDLPFFMPDATLGTVRAVTTKQLEDTGTKMVVVNTFHLLMSYGVEGMKKVGGIKKLMGWSGKVLSDSGGFQVYSLIHSKKNLGKVTQYGAYFRSPIDGRKCTLTPEISIDMQLALDSDVVLVLDDCRFSEIDRTEAEKSVKNTTNWAKRAKAHYLKECAGKERKKKIFAIVHGGNYEDLRAKSAKELMEIGFDGYCFGGWPVDSSGRLTSDILRFVAKLLPDDKPKYAMGVGTPEDMKLCREMGYNMFDCVIPTRNARHGLLYTSHGEIRITNKEYMYDLAPIDKKCRCEACTNYSRAYVHHLFRSKELLGMTLATIHNLTYYNSLFSK